MRWLLLLVIALSLTMLPVHADDGNYYNERCATTTHQYYCAWVDAPTVQFNKRVTAYGRWLRDGEPVTHREFRAINIVTGREYCWGVTNSRGIGQCSFVVDTPNAGFHVLADGEAGERTWVDVIVGHQVWLPIVGQQRSAAYK